jgi:hypothetical protein
LAKFGFGDRSADEPRIARPSDALLILLNTACIAIASNLSWMLRRGTKFVEPLIRERRREVALSTMKLALQMGRERCGEGIGAPIWIVFTQ